MLEQYGVVTAVSPSIEWSYEQPLPSGGVQRIPPRGCAGGDIELVQQVKIFRAGAHIALEGVEYDIAEYIKTHSPINNKYPGRTPDPHPRPERVNRGRPLIMRIADWLLVMAGRQPRLLIEDDAKTRGRICSKCPQNIEWRTGCGPCRDDVIQRGRNLRQRIDYPYADALKGCRLHDFYLPSAVFIDRDNLGDSHVDAPADCWMKTEVRSQ